MGKHVIARERYPVQIGLYITPREKQIKLEVRLIVWMQRATKSQLSTSLH